MKPIFKPLYLVSALTLTGLLTAACAGDADLDTAVRPVRTVVVSGQLGAKTMTTRGLAVGDAGKLSADYNTGEVLAVCYPTGSGYRETTATITSADGTFTATLENPVSGEVRFVYPAVRSKGDGSGDCNTDGISTEQIGTLADIAENWDIATGTATLTVDATKDLDASATLSGLTMSGSPLAIARFDLYGEASTTGPVGVAEVESVQASLFELFADGVLKYKVDHIEAAQVYVAMLPGDLVRPLFRVQQGKQIVDRFVSYRPDATLTVAAGTFYRQPLNLDRTQLVTLGGTSLYCTSGQQWSAIANLNPDVLKIGHIEPGDYIYKADGSAVLMIDGDMVAANTPYVSGKAYSWLPVAQP